MKFPLVALVASISLLCGTAHAAQESSIKIVCEKTDVLVDFLKRKHGEALIAAGRMSDNRGLMTIWVNSDTKSWTVVTTNKNGQSCIILEGDRFMVNDGSSSSPSSSAVPQSRGPVQQIRG